MNQNNLDDLKKELQLGDILYLPSTESTNDLAKQWLLDECPHLSVIVADEQTKGRGRSNRRWYTHPKSAIALSIVLKEGIEEKFFLRYTGLGSLAVCEALLRLHISSVQIKWPNDIMIDLMKVGGVLAEAHWIGTSIKGVVVGIGINITADSLPPEKLLNFPATYIEKHTLQVIDRTQLLKQILASFISWEKKISDQEFIHAWENYLAYIGKQVEIIFNDSDKVVGNLMGITDEGEIILSLGDGRKKHYNASEIRLRPAP